jgi:DNA-binding CsgD family transcriptional regulator/tetratricopeptide (TPR) repeat protein
VTEPGLTLEATELHERSDELSALAALFGLVAESGQGCVALVYGEAGIGKTALLRRFCDDLPPSARVMRGKCDALFTPRPLGPLFDIARGVGGSLAHALETHATPFEVVTALIETVDAGKPTVLVLDDVHLADEATLDVLRILGGRTEGFPALIVLAYREDPLDRWHPVRIVLGEIAAAAQVKRFKLAPLSLQAVAELAGDAVAPDALYRKTLGNPFFVAEVLAAGGEEIPETVRDAVLGRCARLGAAARRLLDCVAITRPQGELWLLEALAGDGVRALEEATTSGVLAASPSAVSFRHELARLVVEQAIPQAERLGLHRRVVELLANPPDGERDPARLAHHAAAVGDAELILEFAPAAAAQASRMGAHREAAAHYQRALRFADRLPLEVRAQLFARNALESYLIVDFPRAAVAQREALSCYEQLGDRRRQAGALAFLAQLLWEVGSLKEGLAATEQALTLLDRGPTPELVGVCSQMAWLQLAAEDPDEAMRWARRAEELADTVADPRTRATALQALGWVEFFSGSPGGFERLVDTLETARASRWEGLAATCYVIIVRTACRRREYEIAEPYIRAGLDYCTERDLDVWRYYLISWQAKVSLARGHWAEATRAAEICLAEPCPFSRIHALVALALVRARRGDPGVWPLLDEALTHAEPRDELQWIAPVAIARAEAAWLEGRHAAAIAETDAAYGAATGTSYEAGLAYWRWRAGAAVPLPDVGEAQYRLEMSGAAVAASEAWHTIGCPYEAAFALLDGDEEDLKRALAELQSMGAGPAARLITRKLRDQGIRGVPRGPRPATRENPAGLTARELEVLELVTHGMTNAQIAGHLVVARKTVDHHVSAILRKLSVRSRGHATAEAARLGLITRV